LRIEHKGGWLDQDAVRLSDGLIFSGSKESCRFGGFFPIPRNVYPAEVAAAEGWGNRLELLNREKSLSCCNPDLKKKRSKKRLMKSFRL
jgi:hypothetical protein